LFDRTAFISGGGSDTLKSIVVLISIITILSASSIEATVKGTVALALSLVALAMGYKRMLPRTGEHAEVVRVQTSVIESSHDVSRRWTRITRIAVGSIVAGAVLAVVVAVLLSSIATQLLSRLS
jgi:hypothetical protein